MSVKYVFIAHLWLTTTGSLIAVRITHHAKIPNTNKKNGYEMIKNGIP